MRARDAEAQRAATLLERTAAYLVDALVTFALWLATAVVVAQGDVEAITQDPATSVVVALLFLLVPFVYFVAAEGLTGTTVGKRAFGLRVVGPRQEPAGLFAATVRNVLRLAWALGPVGPLFLLVDVALVQLSEDDQRLGDSAAATRVVRAPRAGERR